MALARRAFQVSRSPSSQQEPPTGKANEEGKETLKKDDGVEGTGALSPPLSPSHSSSIEGENIEGERGALVSIARDRARLALAAELREEEEFYNDLLPRQMKEINARLKHPHLKFDLGW